MTKKFDKLFEKTNEKMGDNKNIDFEKSDINYKPSKNKKRDIRIQTYLSEDEYKTFISTFKPLDKVANKLRGLILEDIKNRQKK